MPKRPYRGPGPLVALDTKLDTKPLPFDTKTRKIGTKAEPPTDENIQKKQGKEPILGTRKKWLVRIMSPLL